VAKVTDMSYMFFDAESFNQNLCEWGVMNPRVHNGDAFYGTACEDTSDDNWCVNSCN